MGINYTGHVTRLMQDVVARVPELSFIDLSRVLVFARPGRSSADGAYASCHSLGLPTSDPGYFFWRDKTTGAVTRRTEWFVTKSPDVYVDDRKMNYLISFSLPRFTDQTLSRSRKRALYPTGTPDWVAKLDTVVHELYHIDPDQDCLRRFKRTDGEWSDALHSPTYLRGCRGDGAAVSRDESRRAPRSSSCTTTSKACARATAAWPARRSATSRRIRGAIARRWPGKPLPADLANAPGRALHRRGAGEDLVRGRSAAAGVHRQRFAPDRKLHLANRGVV